jgi:hypothetical protein
MLALVHDQDIATETIYVAQGIGTPNQKRVVEEAAAALAARWGTGNPDLSDPVLVAEYLAHNGWRGGYLIVNRKRRLLEVMACGPVRLEVVAALMAAAAQMGFVIRQEHGPARNYLFMARQYRSPVV